MREDFIKKILSTLERQEAEFKLLKKSMEIVSKESNETKLVLNGFIEGVMQNKEETEVNKHSIDSVFELLGDVEKKVSQTHSVIVASGDIKIEKAS